VERKNEDFNCHIVRNYFRNFGISFKGVDTYNITTKTWFVLLDTIYYHRIHYLLRNNIFFDREISGRSTRSFIFNVGIIVSLL
jgi:hypothetical protein